MVEFRRTTNAFNYIFEKELGAQEIVFLKMPTVSPNKRGVNDIGWQTDGAAKLYGTISSDPEGKDALWQEIGENYELNRTVSAIKIENSGSPCKVAVKVILN